jgi:hypothetical protein
VNLKESVGTATAAPAQECVNTGFGSVGVISMVVKMRENRKEANKANIGISDTGLLF